MAAVRKSRKIKVETFTAPAYWTSYFLYGDATELDDEELDAADAFLKAEGLDAVMIVSVDDETFFGRFDGIGYDLTTYTYHA